MYQSEIKKTLRKCGCPVWKLCDILNISRSHYYDLSHHDFKGHEATIKHGIDLIIANHAKKAGADNAD